LRWLQSTAVGAIYAELLDPNIAVTDAQFSKSGDVRDFWREGLDARDEQILMTWYQMGEPFLVHTQPNSIPGPLYGMCTVLIPADGDLRWPISAGLGLPRWHVAPHPTEIAAAASGRSMCYDRRT
jgi:hypothetical protein